MQLDQREITQDGVTYLVRLEEDTDSSPEDADCYGPEDIAAWRAGDWQYVGVIVSPFLPKMLGIDTSTAEDSLWGVEYGYSPGFVSSEHRPTGVVDFDELIGSYPVPDMICEVRGRLAHLRETLPAMLADLAALPLDDCPATHPSHPGIANGHCRRAAGHEMPHTSDFGDWS